MSETADSIVSHYRDARAAYQGHGPNADAILVPRRGGPLDVGYPEDPNKKAEPAADSGAEAMNAPRPVGGAK